VVVPVANVLLFFGVKKDLVFFLEDVVAEDLDGEGLFFWMYFFAEFDEVLGLGVNELTYKHNAYKYQLHH